MFPGQFILLLRIQWKFKEAVRCAGTLYDGKKYPEHKDRPAKPICSEEGAIRLPQGDELEKLKEENPHILNRDVWILQILRRSQS